jgi:hypothetical protein
MLDDNFCKLESRAMMLPDALRMISLVSIVACQLSVCLNENGRQLMVKFCAVVVVNLK